MGGRRVPQPQRPMYVQWTTTSGKTTSCRVDGKENAKSWVKLLGKHGATNIVTEPYVDQAFLNHAEIALGRRSGPEVSVLSQEETEALHDEMVANVGDDEQQAQSPEIVKEADGQILSVEQVAEADALEARVEVELEAETEAPRKYTPERLASLSIGELRKLGSQEGLKGAWKGPNSKVEPLTEFLLSIPAQ